MKPWRPTVLQFVLSSMLLSTVQAQQLTDEQEGYVQSLLDSSEKFKLKDPPKSLALALQVLDLLPDTGYEKMQTFAHLRAANSEKIASHRNASLDHVNQAIRISAAMLDSNLMMRSAFMKASIFGFYDESDSALIYFQRTIDLYRPGYDVFFAANAYTNIGGLFRSMGNLPKAESYLRKGFQISKGDRYTWIFTLSRLISFYSDQKDPRYIHYLDTFYMSDFARNASKENVNGHFYTFLNINNATLAEKEMKLWEVYRFSKQQSAPIHQVEFGLKLNALLVEQNKQEASFELLKELLAISVQAGNGKMEAEVNRALYQNAKARKELIKALTFMERFSFINDSLHTAEKQTQIQELNVKFEVAQKDHEIERQELSLAQAKRNRNFLFIVIALLTGIAGLTVLYFRNRIKTTRRLQAQEEIIHMREREKLIQEKEVIHLTASLESQEKERSRIARDLHDGLGSQMSGISARIENLLSKDPDNMQYSALKKMVKETATELRRTSYELMPATLLRMGLEPALQDLCINLLIKNGIELSLEIESDLSQLTPDHQLIVYRIVQELLNNIVKHAAASHVLVQFSSYDDEMTLVVEDNGKGFSVSEINLSGIGLGSIKSRVELLHGFLDIASTPGDGTTVTINFPVNKANGQMNIENQ